MITDPIMLLSLGQKSSSLENSTEGELFNAISKFTGNGAGTGNQGNVC